MLRKMSRKKGTSWNLWYRNAIGGGAFAPRSSPLLCRQLPDRAKAWVALLWNTRFASFPFIPGHENTGTLVKVGSGVLTEANGLNMAAINDLTTDIHLLRKRGLEVILVSSGAIASGLKKIGFSKSVEYLFETDLTEHPIQQRHSQRNT